MAISLYDAYDKKVWTTHTDIGLGSFSPIIRDNLLTVMEIITFIKIWTDCFSEVLSRVQSNSEQFASSTNNNNYLS